MEEEREEKIRQAFQKIKEDMDFLKQEIQKIKQELTKIPVQHIQHNLPTHPQQSSTYSQEYEGIKPQFSVSTRNRGVPADSQQTPSTQLKDLFMNKSKESKEPTIQQSSQLTLRQLKNAVSNLTQEIKNKFKNLSKQEFYIFSLVYNLDVVGQKPDYKTLAVKANLTESSVRDYIARLIHKGIPIKKERINNKEIQLSIPDEFKNLATLDSLSKLKEGNFF